jgi:phosphoribosylglycinamide formyltransferase-1
MSGPHARDPSPAPFRIAVLASGRGSNLNALIEACDRGEIAAQIAGVFSDKPACGAVAIARAAKIPVHAMRPRDFGSREIFDDDLFAAVGRVQPDLIVCAGYMRLISAAAVGRVTGRMINIHPSLLPRYPGLDTHARALAAGDTEHGASVHYVIPELDAGPVISQVRVPVLADDDATLLAARVIAREHALLCATVREIVDGRVRMVGDHAQLDGETLDAPLQLGADGRLQLSTAA